MEEHIVKVKMRRSVGTATGAYSKGDEVDLDDKLAKAWIDGGVADAVEEPKRKRSKSDEDEG